MEPVRTRAQINCQGPLLEYKKLMAVTIVSQHFILEFTLKTVSQEVVETLSFLAPPVEKKTGFCLVFRKWHLQQLRLFGQNLARLKITLIRDLNIHQMSLIFAWNI